MRLAVGGWLEDRDFGACGGTVLGKNSPAEETPPLCLLLPPLNLNRPLRCATVRKQRLGTGCPSISLQGSSLPSGPEQFLQPPTSSFWPSFFFSFFLFSSLLQLLWDWLAHGASRQHLIRNEGASLSSGASCCCSHPPTVTPWLGFSLSPPCSPVLTSPSHLHRVLGLNYLDGGLGRGRGLAPAVMPVSELHKADRLHCIARCGCK